jgi:hypothetical protein
MVSDGQAQQGGRRLIAASCLLGLLALCLTLFSAHRQQAIEPVKIGRDDTALDLTATTEIYNQRGEAFQVSTAAGADGIVRRIEVRANSTRAFGRLGGVCAGQCHR